jgi:DNA-binding transcriptional ArsR family regulator
MSQNAAIARALAALGHEARLAIYRLLVRAGEDGQNVGEIAAHLKMPASTLAHHLSTLVAAGLVIQERHGREVVNRVDYEAMRCTVGFLTDQCCAGVSLASGASVAKEDAA